MNEKEFEKNMKSVFAVETDYIPDDGFTDNLLQRLPRKKAMTINLKTVFAILACVLSLAILYVTTGIEKIAWALVDVFAVPFTGGIPSLTSVVLTGSIIFLVLYTVKTRMDT